MFEVQKVLTHQDLNDHVLIKHLSMSCQQHKAQVTELLQIWPLQYREVTANDVRSVVAILDAKESKDNVLVRLTIDVKVQVTVVAKRGRYNTYWWVFWCDVLFIELQTAVREPDT